jgi:scyllo-inositol 2-dehydrogenase (NADP+)
MIRVGIAGYGIAGAVFHAPLVATTPGIELVGVVTRDPGRAERVAVDHPDAVVVPDVEALFGLGIDLLVVATTNDTHVSLARAALAAGVSVVVDKPLAPTAAEGRALVEEATAAGVLLSTFQNRRWDSDFRTVQTLVASGALGDVRRLESRFERWRPELGGGWRERDDPGTAGGLLFDLGSHLVDQALVLLGPVVAVYAETDRRRSPEAADDDVFVALEHLNGARSHLWASAVAPILGPRFRVLGSRAAYVCRGLDGQEDALRAGARPGAVWGDVPPDRWGVLGTVDEQSPVSSLPGAYPTYYVEMAAAVSAHVEGRPAAAVPVDPWDSVRGLEILEAARRSAAEHAVIPT